MSVKALTSVTDSSFGPILIAISQSPCLLYIMRRTDANILSIFLVQAFGVKLILPVEHYVGTTKLRDPQKHGPRVLCKRMEG